MFIALACVHRVSLLHLRRASLAQWPSSLTSEGTCRTAVGALTITILATESDISLSQHGTCMHEYAAMLSFS